jgi:hypothetical protein
MAITVDWSTKTFFVPQADLTLVSGTLYEMNTETDFRQAINAIMADEDGIVFEDPIDHNTTYSVAGVTYARKIEVINGYNITLTPDSQWTVRLTGSNNNLFDVENGILNQNQVQVIANNSAGLIITGTSGLTPTESAQLSAMSTNVASILKLETGRWKIDTATNQMIFYDDDGVTPLYTFDLKDAGGSPTSSSPFERVPA